MRNPATGELCDTTAIAGAAFGFQIPSEGPLKVGDFSDGEAPVVSKLRSLGFEVVRMGEDWSEPPRISRRLIGLSAHACKTAYAIY